MRKSKLTTAAMPSLVCLNKFNSVPVMVPVRPSSWLVASKISVLASGCVLSFCAVRSLSLYSLKFVFVYNLSQIFSPGAS